MDLITQQALDHLLNSHQEWSMSLFMPAHRAGRETQKDPIRYKNLLNKAEEKLEVRGFRSPEVQNILKPAYDLLEDYDFWQHQSDGLAVFASPQSFDVYRLPIRFEELVVISNHFHIKPLLPLFSNDGHFYILALSQNEVRLLEGTQYTVDEVDMEKNLPNLAETLKFDLFSKQLQFHTGTARETDSGEGAAMFFGHDPSDKEEKRLLHWFHKVDDVLSEVITNRQSPIVLAGVDYLFPLFKKTSSFTNIMEKGVEGNPDDLRAEEIHTKAWPLIKPYFMETQNEAFSRYKDLSNTDQVTTNLEKTFLAAYQARIELVFTVEDYQVWGYYDVKTNKVHIHNEFQTGDEDLLNLISIYTLKNGGTVFVVDEGMMPAKAPQAAILRF